jgi:hypothetical protein
MRISFRKRKKKADKKGGRSICGASLFPFRETLADGSGGAVLQRSRSEKNAPLLSA